MPWAKPARTCRRAQRGAGKPGCVRPGKEAGMPCHRCTTDGACRAASCCRGPPPGASATRAHQQDDGAAVPAVERRRQQQQEWAAGGGERHAGEDRKRRVWALHGVCVVGVSASAADTPAAHVPSTVLTVPQGSGPELSAVVQLPLCSIHSSPRNCSLVCKAHLGMAHKERASGDADHAGKDLDWQLCNAPPQQRGGGGALAPAG